MTVLYIVTIDAATSVPLEAAGEIAKKCSSHGIDFYTATYYRQNTKELKTEFVEALIELNFTKSYHLQNLGAYYRLIKTIKPDILHLHHGISAFQGALLAKLAGVKTIFKTEHNNHKFYKWYQKIFTVPLFLLTSKIICNSESTMLSYYPWEKKIAGSKSVFVYNGINPNDILHVKKTVCANNTRQMLSVESGDTLLVSVGRLIEQKNYKRLIAAMADVCAQNTSVKLVIVGGGEQEQQLKKMIEDEHLQHAVFLTGMVPREQVYRLVNACDFFIISSLWEGFCNSLVEAMAAGKPVLCSDIQTLREVAGNSAVSFFNPLCVSSIARSISQVSHLSEEERSRFAGKAQERALNNFTLEKTAEKYIAEYLKTISHHV